MKIAYVSGKRLIDGKQIHPKALKVVMGYRKCNQRQLCEKVDGLHASNLSKFLNGEAHILKERQLREIMKALEWPFEILHKDFPPILTSKGWMR